MKLSKTKLILSSLLIAVYFILAISVMALAYVIEAEDNILCGSLVICSGITHILLYLCEDGYKTNQENHHLIFGLISTGLGICFIANENLPLNDICLYWGLLEIVESSTEIALTIRNVKNNILLSLEVIASLMNFVLAVLLCIHLEEGIHLHLVFFAIAFLILGIKYILNLLSLRFKK